MSDDTKLPTTNDILALATPSKYIQVSVTNEFGVICPKDTIKYIFTDFERAVFRQLEHIGTDQKFILFGKTNTFTLRDQEGHNWEESEKIHLESKNFSWSMINRDSHGFLSQKYVLIFPRSTTGSLG